MLDQITRNYDNSFKNEHPENRLTILEINQILVEKYPGIFRSDWVMTDQDVQARLFEKPDSKHEYGIRWTFSPAEPVSEMVRQGVMEAAAEGIAQEMRWTINTLACDGLRPHFYIPAAVEVKVNPKTYDPEAVLFGLYDIVPL